MPVDSSESIQSACSLLFNIREEPPTLEQIKQARDRLGSAIKAQRTASRNQLILIASTALSAAVAAALNWDSSIYVSLFMATAGFVMYILAKVIWHQESDEEQNIRQLDTMSTGFLEDVAEACRLDPQADAYRIKVVEQGREFVVAEGWQFHAWRRTRGSSVWSLVHSPQPIAPSQA